MPQIHVKANIKPVAQVLNTKVAAGAARNLRIILPEIADRIIATVRQGNWFTNETGNLKKKLYRSRPRVRQGGGEIDVGWAGDASIYGPVLEFGPKKKEWIIKPKGARADGTKVKALRWVANGKVFYAKSVRHVWTPKSLRPHFMPAVTKLRPFINKKLSQAVDDAFRASGLK